MRLDGGQFFVVNKIPPEAKLDQFGSRENDVIPSLNPYNAEQIWRLEEKQGFYYIHNVLRPQWRLTKFSISDDGNFT